jgi:LPXTG-motif cell wall-anchored protein
MPRMVKRSLLVVLTLAGLVFAASADAQSNGRAGHGQTGSPGNGGSSRPRAAPEFDPAAAGAIATLLGGAGLLLARRRR